MKNNKVGRKKTWTNLDETIIKFAILNKQSFTYILNNLEIKTEAAVRAKISKLNGRVIRGVILPKKSTK